jgi:hypothetical protein
MLGRVEKRPRERVELKRPTAVRVASAAVDGSVVTMTFDQPIVLKGTPDYSTDVAGAAAVSATSTTLNSVDITFDADVSTATVVNIPVADPSVRNKVGGFVADTTFPIGS